MNKYSNINNVPLSIAVWLGTDSYDHNNDPKTISVTSLLKPIREIILTMQLKPEDIQPTDISTLVASRMGTAIHTGIETAWVKNYVQALLDMGYPKGLIGTIRINPTKQNIEDARTAGIDITPIYMEMRTDKVINGWTISGKFDFIGDGRLEDFKSTSVYSYIFDSNGEKYKQQGSIYRWLNPDIITQDIMAIQFIFTDWSALKARTDRSYPPAKTHEHKLPLMSYESTERFISEKLTQIETYKDKPQNELPLCTPKELWRKGTIWKYYKNPAKKSRSTKNFNSAFEANTRLTKDGSIGIIDEVRGEVVACKYCNVVGVCEQAKQLILSGDLKI